MQRFISEDPIEFLGGDVNLYAYVGNNPTNLVDPDGRIIAQAIGGGIGLGFGIVAGAKFCPTGDLGCVTRSALVGLVAGAFSTVPIPGLNPLLGGAAPFVGGAAAGGITAFLGNVATQTLVEGKSLEHVDVQSAGLSGLAGLIGGGLGGAVANLRQLQALAPGAAATGRLFTDLGQEIVGATIGGVSAGGLDIFFHEVLRDAICLETAPLAAVPFSVRLAGRGCK